VTRRFIVSADGDIVEVREVIVTVFPTLDVFLLALRGAAISWASGRYI
jgi:hypothetical protein